VSDDESLVVGGCPAVLAGRDLLVRPAHAHGQAVDEQLTVGRRRVVDLLHGE
jgi:hypothetical protein